MPRWCDSISTHMKIIVYTTNLGDYDNLHEAPNDDLTYLYFTDTEAPNGWTKMEMQGDSRKESRYYKINSHLLPPHDISIYIDACYEFKKNMTNFSEFVKDCDIAISKHGKDDTIYEHLGTCISTGKDNPEKMIKQVARYLNEGLPEHILTENSIIIRKNNERVKKFNEIWWQEYLTGSERDQLSSNYAIWKSGVKFSLLPFSARDNEYLSGWARHRDKKFEFNPQDTPLWEELKSDIMKLWS
jgi:hypothetical protein